MVDEDNHTVDGSEILRSPVEVGSLSHYSYGFIYIPGGACQIFFSIDSISPTWIYNLE